MKPTAAVFVTVLAVLAAIGGFAAYRLVAAPSAAAQAEQAPAISFTDLNGEPQALQQWRGKTVLVNFWATWCAPCLKEIPMLVRAQQDLAGRGLQIIGPAMDDAAAVRKFVQAHDIAYPVFAGTTEIIQAMDALGDRVGALPLSVLITPDGEIVRRKSGELSREELEQWLAPYLQPA